MIVSGINCSRVHDIDLESSIDSLLVASLSRLLRSAQTARAIPLPGPQQPLLQSSRRRYSLLIRCCKRYLHPRAVSRHCRIFALFIFMRFRMDAGRRPLHFLQRHDGIGFSQHIEFELLLTQTLI